MAIRAYECTALVACTASAQRRRLTWHSLPAHGSSCLAHTAGDLVVECVI